MAPIDTFRHDEVFSKTKFGDTRIDVVGCGAVGSKIALSLAKLGITNLHIWDFDTIVSHNIPNQIFGIGDVDQKKVDITKKYIKDLTGLECVAHDEKITTPQTFGRIVFMAVDSMKARKEIWESSIRMKPNVILYIEARMGIDNGRLYSIQPFVPGHVENYEKTLYTDDQVVEASACGSSPSVGPTSDIVSGYCVWQFMRWFAIRNGFEDVLENEVIFSVRSPMILSNNF